MHALASEFGVWASAQHNVAVSGLPIVEAVSGVLDRAANGVVDRLGSRRVVRCVDYRREAGDRPRWLAAAPLVELELEGGRVLLRPSGTEPKLKLYVDLRADVGGAATRGTLEASLANEALELARELVAKLGLIGEDARS